MLPSARKYRRQWVHLQRPRVEDPIDINLDLRRSPSNALDTAWLRIAIRLLSSCRAHSSPCSYFLSIFRPFTISKPFPLICQCRVCTPPGTSRLGSVVKVVSFSSLPTALAYSFSHLSSSLSYEVIEGIALCCHGLTIGLLEHILQHTACERTGNVDHAGRP